MGITTERGDATGQSGIERTNEGNADGEVTEDDVFEVLYNVRRRAVVDYLQDIEGRVDVGDLAEHIAAEETDTSREELSSYDRKRVYVSLYQNHLPLMDDANVVDYDEDRKTVRLLEGASELEPYLGEESRPVDDRVVAGVVLTVATLVLLGSLQVGVFAALPASSWAVLGVAVLVGAACLRVYAAVGR